MKNISILMVVALFGLFGCNKSFEIEATKPGSVQGNLLQEWQTSLPATFSSSQNSLTSHQVSGRDIAMNANGDVVVVWIQNNALYKSERFNGVWKHPADFSESISINNNNASNPSVALNDAGYAVITWRHSDALNAQSVI